MLKNRLPDSYIIQEGVQLGYMTSMPTYVDTSDDSNIYLGYCQIDSEYNKHEQCLICKIHIGEDVVTRYFADGLWEDRADLEYK